MQVKNTRNRGGPKVQARVPTNCRDYRWSSVLPWWVGLGLGSHSSGRAWGQFSLNDVLTDPPLGPELLLYEKRGRQRRLRTSRLGGRGVLWLFVNAGGRLRLSSGETRKFLPENRSGHVTYLKQSNDTRSHRTDRKITDPTFVEPLG